MTSFKHILGLLVLIAIAAACSQPERVTIDQDPATAAGSDTTEERPSQAAFQQLNIGEYNQIRSLDPLFAENAATMRAVQLIHEGLVRFDDEGEVTPGLAYNWSVSDDSLSYEFHLRPEIFYHDSQVFSTGTGRRIVSDDVRFTFERMASMNVPPQAAGLFMNIEGFEPYFQEQRHVYNPQNREVQGITGIETPDDSTVVFHLDSQDSAFTQKLATPLASIYPEEAVTGSSSITPVGSGPFAFTQITDDSTLVLSKFQDYYEADNINLNRIDIHFDSSQTALAKAMEGEELHILPQLGPQLMVSMINEEEQLHQEYENQFELQTPGGAATYVLRHNPQSGLSDSTAHAILGYLKNDTTSYFNQFPGTLVQSDSLPSSREDITLPQQNLYAMYADDPYAKTFLGSLSNQLAGQGISLQMMNIRAPTHQTSLLFSTEYPLLPDSQWGHLQGLFSFSIEQAALQQAGLEGLSYNQYPWWFDLRNVSLPSTATD